MKTLAMVAMVLFIGFTVTRSQTITDEKVKTQSTTETKQGKYVDANKNGICDNFENKNDNVKGKGFGFVDANKNGICDNYENKNGNVKGRGSGFIDANKDGICDNREKPCCGNGYGHKYGKGNGYGRGNGNGQGCRYRNGQNNK